MDLVAIKLYYACMRLDKYLVEKYPEYSRSQIQKLIEDGFVLVNGKKSKSAQVLTEKDKVKLKKMTVNTMVLQPEPFDLAVLYEDASCFVVDKPAGLIVHPGDSSKAFSGTLANALLTKIGDGFPGNLRPGIVHRLDRDTSGLMVIAKTVAAYEDLVAQFKARTIRKFYITLVAGNLAEPEGVIEGGIGRDVRNRKKMAIVQDGKDAVSIYKVKEVYVTGRYYSSLVDVEIKSGRTHQIRVHFAAIKYPVLGDATYGSEKLNSYFKDKFSLNRQFLHACGLCFKSPETGKLVECKSELPKDLQDVLVQIR